MAKLSANGRKEVARVSKERDLSETESDLIAWERTTATLMSDGSLLTKRDVQFRASVNTKSYKHSYGWKKHHKFKAEITPELVAKFIQSYGKLGYT